MERHLVARRALCHPLWLTSLALLVLNDHVFKGSGKLPALVTGKLSDFAGLIVAPALLAVLLRLSSRRSVFVAHVVTGAVFAAINVCPPVARAFEALAALGPFAWQITVDPTDLLALPALLASFVVLVPAMDRSVPERPIAQPALVAIGSIACMATSEPVDPPPFCDDPISCGAVPREDAAIVVGNTTESQRLIRVRALKDSVTWDCGTMLVDPTHALSRELFAPAETWLLEPQRGLPLKNSLTHGCVAYLIDADGLSPMLLAWSSTQFPQTSLSTSTVTPDGSTMVNLSMDPTGKLVLADHPVVFDAPPLEEPKPTGACAVPDPGVGVEWSPPPSVGPMQIVSIESSPDDCHLMTFDTQSSMYLCIPAAAMPFQAGDTIEVTPAENMISSSYAEGNGEFPRVEGLIVRGPSHTVLVLRGNVLARYALAGITEPLTEPTVEVDTATGCPGSHDECGSLSIPLEIAYFGDHVGPISFVKAGTNLTLADGYGTIYVVRAQAMPIRDTKCPPFAEVSRHYESVLVVPTVP